MGKLTARQQLDNLADAMVEDIMGLSDEEILAELREDGIDPEVQATDMRKLVDRAVFFAPVEDVNGRPRPRWEEMLEEKVSAGLVGEALSLVRYLIGLRTASDTGDQLREQLAALAHEQWCGWMTYLFKQGTTHDDGSFTIRSWAVERWVRQMGTLYTDLPDEEKALDRAEADRVLAILRGDT